MRKSKRVPKKSPQPLKQSQPLFGKPMPLVSTSQPIGSCHLHKPGIDCPAQLENSEVLLIRQVESIPQLAVAQLLCAQCRNKINIRRYSQLRPLARV